MIQRKKLTYDSRDILNISWTPFLCSLSPSPSTPVPPPHYPLSLCHCHCHFCHFVILVPVVPLPIDTALSILWWSVLTIIVVFVLVVLCCGVVGTGHCWVIIVPVGP